MDLELCSFVLSEVVFILCYRQTLVTREKDQVAEYRFMPEPNLPPLRVYRRDSVPSSFSESAVIIENISEHLPVLPSQLREKLHRDFGLSLLSASALGVGFCYARIY